jgi:hypothetical protein
MTSARPSLAVKSIFKYFDEIFPDITPHCGVSEQQKQEREEKVRLYWERNKGI